jgi:hypothetical protein
MAMPCYAVDSIRQPFTGTGIWEPVKEWIETPEGKRRPGDKQARDENTGMPLWAVEVLYIQTSFGRKSTVAAKVTVPHEEEPKVAPLSPIGFTGLRVEVRTNQAGGFAEYWTAEGLMESSKAASSVTGSSRAASGEGKAA